MKAQVVEKNCFSKSIGFFSINIKSRFVFIQASPVVALPLVLSSTISYSLLYVFTLHVQSSVYSVKLPMQTP